MGLFAAAVWTRSLGGRRGIRRSSATLSRGKCVARRYVATPDFWNRTLQNWQSEFLAIGSMAVLSIYLRQRGSPESKPVGTPHTATGVEG